MLITWLQNTQLINWFQYCPTTIVTTVSSGVQGIVHNIGVFLETQTPFNHFFISLTLNTQVKQQVIIANADHVASIHTK